MDTTASFLTFSFERAVCAAFRAEASGGVCAPRQRLTQLRTRKRVFMTHKSLTVGLLYLIALTSIAAAQNTSAVPARAGAASDAQVSQVEPEGSGSHAPAPPPKPSCGRLWPPEDKDAIARIGSMFVRPANVPQLLENLKLAYDKKLLLLGEFYDEGNLIKFFGSEKITSSGQLLPAMRGVANQVIELAPGDGELRGLTVGVTRGCLPAAERRSAAGVVRAHLEYLGSVTVKISGTPEFTVNAVRSVLGKESRFVVEEDGPHRLSPTGKGWLIYEDPAGYRSGMAVMSGREMSFLMNLSLAGRGPEYVNEPLFGGDDKIETVGIFESER
jgi:hypothetical protein